MSYKNNIIFGLKEDSRPKGEGYLYLSFSGKIDGQPLVYLDLYKTSDEQFRELLLKVLPTFLSGKDTECIELVNFKPSTADIFRNVASAYTKIEIVSLDTEVFELHL